MASIRRGAVVFGILLLLTGPIVSGGPASAQDVYVPHPIIAIESESDYAVGPVPNAATAGVVRGSGTASDPYVIEGWDISLGAAGIGFEAGITIDNSLNAHVVIQKNRFHDLGRGIELYDAAHITIQDNVFENVGYGVVAHEETADDLVIRRNQFTVNHGIRLLGGIHGPTGLVIEDNTFASRSTGTGLFLQRPTTVTISGNTISDFKTGIFCNACSSVTIDHNTIQDNDVGIDIRFGDGVITDNEIRDNRIGAQMADDWPANGNNIRGNSEAGVTHERFSWHSPDWSGNYWGSALGPGPCEGCGDNVTGLQESEYEPYLLLPNEDAGA